MKLLYISILALLLTSCSIFEKTPDSVSEGQRGVYQGILLMEENVVKILMRYVEDSSAVIVYQWNFIYEPLIQEIRLDPSLSKEDKSQQITALENERDGKIQADITAIRANATSMAEQCQQNIDLTKRLATSVYNYLATSPIEVDNIAYWIEKLEKLKDKLNN